ncbi:hypothetical protein VP1G_01143 [Cytospora mali]|uniref:Uncharacterized protein n=1 Tax=Cytospora mali TaxID=578113 RepID=A0A194UPV3_CYTMA|nr:hypothetical protein VP1G_01143 [Valsa mali var. pyri (nom. inval.)]
MPFRLPYLSLYLRQLVSGKAPSGKPWTKTIRNKVTIQDVVRNQLTLSQRHPLRRMEEQRAVVFATRRHWLHAAPARPTLPPARKDDKSKSAFPEGFEMTEAEIFEREIDPTDKDSWSRGPDMLWLNDVSEARGRATPRLEPPRFRLKGPYIHTEEGLVHISTYFP